MSTTLDPKAIAIGNGMQILAEKLNAVTDEWSILVLCQNDYAILSTRSQEYNGNRLSRIALALESNRAKGYLRHGSDASEDTPSENSIIYLDSRRIRTS